MVSKGRLTIQFRDPALGHHDRNSDGMAGKDDRMSRLKLPNDSLR